MSADIAGLFEQYAREEVAVKRHGVAFRHPILLTAAAVRALSQLLDGGQLPARAKGRLAELDQLRSALIDSPQMYPIGVGPLEPIAQQVVDDELSFDAGIARVREPAFREHLSQTYLVCLMNHAFDLAQASKPDAAWSWGRLILEGCLAANPDGPLEQRLAIVGHSWTRVVTHLLNHVPRGDVFQWSAHIFDGLIERAEANQQRAQLGVLLHAVGALYSDPFIGSRSGNKYDLQLAEWQQRLTAVYGTVRAARLREQSPLPSPQVAVRKAVAYFYRALPNVEGEHRGISAKAIVNCLHWQRDVFGEAVDLAEASRLAQIAFELLPPGSYHETALRLTVESLGLSAPSGVLTVAAAEPGGSAHQDDVVQRALVMRQTNPTGALALLVDAAPQYGLDAPIALRLSRWELMASLVAPAAGVELPSAENRDEFQHAFEALMQQANAAAWPPEKAAAATFGMALRTTTIAAEDVGLNLLGTLKQVFPAFVQVYAELIAYISSVLYIGAAVNAVQVEQRADAIGLYARAVTECLTLQMDGRVRELSERIADLAGMVSAPGARPSTLESAVSDPFLAALLAIVGISHGVESRLGFAGAEVLQAAYRRLLRGAAGVNTGTLSGLMQFAKGARFSSSIKDPHWQRWSDDSLVAELIAEIVRLESSNPARSVTATASIEDELELLSHGSERDAVGGEQAELRLFNLRRAVNQRLDDSSTMADRREAFMPPEEIFARLSQRSVLLDLFLTEHDDNSQALVAMVYTNEEVRVFQNIIAEPRAIAELKVRGRNVYLSGLALMVARLREQIQQFSGARPVQRDAAESLGLHPWSLFGPSLFAYLDTLKTQGKDHLSICPNQWLRYYPLHLLAPAGRWLAEDWIVTYLPSLQCLSRQSAAVGKAQAVSVLALTYRPPAPFALPYLDSAEAEATDIARTFGTTPLLDEQVTERSIVHALANSRYVHLCAHGQHDASAPVFQTLFATPCAEQDGRLRAYELAGEDFRGLEVVTVAACESALGRFDVSDNLTGFPATLLAAGAETIIGSMWRAHDGASRLFFTAFYTQLERGASRLDAFQVAQAKTRGEFPALRHWGAFCLLGRW